ncbi:MAG TPA: hypothetical protein DEA40_15705, partial [Parvularcula sp.]|nr:hypothetical protein [Parvularcula sp.]
MAKQDKVTKDVAAGEAEAEGRPRGRLKRAVAAAAPKIARELGGPLAGAAVEALSRAIFGSEAADADV